MKILALLVLFVGSLLAQYTPPNNLASLTLPITSPNGGTGANLSGCAQGAIPYVNTASPAVFTCDATKLVIDPSTGNVVIGTQVVVTGGNVIIGNSTSISGKGPFAASYGATTFSGTLDPRIAFGYNSTFDGQLLTASENALTLNIEGDYNDGANHQAEAYISYLSSNGSVNVRPWIVSIDRVTNVPNTAFSGKVLYYDNASVNSYAVLNPSTGFLGLFAPTPSPILPVERLDIKDGNVYVRSSYPGAGNTPATQRMFFESIQAGGFRVAGAGMEVGYTRLSDSDYASALTFYTTADNAPAARMTVLGSGNVGVGTISPVYGADIQTQGASGVFHIKSNVAVTGHTFGLVELGAGDSASTVTWTNNGSETILGTLGVTGLSTLTGGVVTGSGAYLQVGARSTDPGCTVTGDIGKLWFDNTSAVTTLFKVCVEVTSTPTWVTK